MRWLGMPRPAISILAAHGIGTVTILENYRYYDHPILLEHPQVLETVYSDRLLDPAYGDRQRE
jgi:hypothetical protein